MSKRKILISIFSVTILAILLLVGLLLRQYVVPILMYHSVNPNAKLENRLEVSTSTFARQMYFLKKYRYNVLPLSKLANLIKDKKKIPPRTVAITFDDGYKDLYNYAFPILKKYNLPATIFIIVDEVGRPQNDRLSWDEIKAMQDSGVITFGSHTLTHRYLEEIGSDEELKKEIFDSKRILEEKLGRPIVAFSYPTGRFTPRMRQLAIDAGYEFAVTTSPGRRFANDDIFALKRLRISGTSNNLFIFWLETSGFYTFIKERRDSE